MLVVITNNVEFEGISFEGTTKECIEAVEILKSDELKGHRFNAEFYDGSRVTPQYTVQFYATGLTLTAIHSD